MEGVVQEVSSIVMEDEGTGSAEADQYDRGAQLGARQDPAEAMAEQEGDAQEIMEEDGEALMPVPEVSGAAVDEETWQALLDDQDEEEDEEEKAGKDDDYCPANEDEEEEEGVEDLDFEAEKEEQERGEEEEEEPINSEDDDLLDDDHEGRKHKKGKKGSISPELASTPLMSAGTAYSPSSLAAEIFSVTIKKKMGGPTCDPDFAVPKKKGKRKSNGSSAAAKKQPVKKRKGGWGPSSPNGSGGGYGSSATYSKRSTNKQAIDLMHRSVTAIPMSSVPVIFARVLKTLPPSDYDIYEIQNLIVTYALDEARYSGAAAAAAASSAAGTDESSEVSSGNGTATNTDTGTSIGTAVEGSEVGSGISDSTAATAATGDDGSSGTPSATMTTEATTTTETATSNASGNGINDGITESGDASGGSGSSSGGTIAGEVSDAGAEVGSNSEEDIEERIYQDVMRMVTTDKKFLHRHVPIGHSSFSHVQTDAAMLKKYEAFLNSPDERSKRRDYLSEGGSARHGWTEEELERYAEAIDRSGGNIRLAAKMLGTGLDRMHYFLFFYKRILSERIAAAGH